MDKTYCPSCHKASIFSGADATDDCEHCGSALLLQNRWWLREMLGHGASGYTWKGVDVDDGSVVAIKELSFRRLTDLKQLELFERETEALASLDHEAVPNFIDQFIVEEDRFVSAYLVQEYIDGGVLKASARTDEEEVLQFLEEMADLLEYLHSRRPPVIHRDIKPSNVMRRLDGRYVLIDFGAIRGIVEDTMGGSTVAGTLGYMPPEQLVGRAVMASDYYGLGATALALLSGQQAHHLIEHHRPGAWREKVELSPAMADLLERLLEVDQVRRLKNPGALRRAIEKVRNPGPVPSVSSEPSEPFEPSQDTLPSLAEIRDSKRERVRRERRRASSGRLRARGNGARWTISIFVSCAICSLIILSYLRWTPWLFPEIWTQFVHTGGGITVALVFLAVPTFFSFMVLGAVPLIVARTLVGEGKGREFLLIPGAILFTVLYMGWSIIGFSTTPEDIYIVQKGEETRFIARTVCKFRVINESGRYVSDYTHGASGCRTEVVDGRFLRVQTDSGLYYLDAWSGEILFDLSREAHRLGGEGDFRILSTDGSDVEVELQDGMTHNISAQLPEGARSAQFFSPLAMETKVDTELHRPTVLIPSNCGACDDCGPVVSHYSTAFGEGRQMVSGLDGEGRALWTEEQSSSDFFDIKAAYDVGGQCWVYIPRGLNVSEVLELDRETGGLSRVWRF